MAKEFNKFEIARLKKFAQISDQYIQRKSKLIEKRDAIQAEIDSLQAMIDANDTPVRLITGGHGIEEIITKRIIPTDKLDKNGNIIKQTVFEFKYPDTIVPPVIEETAEEPTEAVMPEMGNDFDIDTERLDSEENNY